MKFKQLLLLFITLACLVAATGCATTETNSSGVTVDKKRSGGLLQLIPFR